MLEARLFTITITPTPPPTSHPPPPAQNTLLSRCAHLAAQCLAHVHYVSQQIHGTLFSCSHDSDHGEHCRL